MFERGLVVLAFATATALASPGASAAGGGGLRERLDEQRNLAPEVDRLSPSGRSAFEALCDQAKAAGRMPSIVGFLDRLAAPPKPITRDDFDRLWYIFSMLQQPPIDRSGLAEVFQLRARSITTFECVYTTRYTGGADDGLSVRRRFVMDGEKLFYESSYQGGPRDGAELRFLRSAYDSRDVRNYEFHGPEGDSIRQKTANASIQPLTSTTRFLGRDNPVLLEKLFDPRSRFGIDTQWDDLAWVATSTAVYETPVEFAGRSCLVIGGTTLHYFLAPELGYALVGIRDGLQTFDDRLGRVVRHDSPQVSQAAADFVECYSGLWMPKRCERVVEEKGGVVTSERTEVQAYRVNQEVDPKTFSDVIPDGVYVADVRRNVVYLKGADKSVESTLKTVVGPRRARHLWLLLLNSVALAGLGLAFLLRDRLKRQPPRARWPSPDAGADGSGAEDGPAHPPLE